MLTIHYSPGSHYPNGIGHDKNLIWLYGKAWFVENMPTKGDICTNDFLPIAIASKRIRDGASKDDYLVMEYRDGGRSHPVRFDQEGELEDVLVDHDEYQLRLLID